MYLCSGAYDIRKGQGQNQSQGHISSSAHGGRFLYHKWNHAKSFKIRFYQLIHVYSFNSPWCKFLPQRLKNWYHNVILYLNLWITYFRYHMQTHVAHLGLIIDEKAFRENSSQQAMYMIFPSRSEGLFSVGDKISARKWSGTRNGLFPVYYELLLLG